MNENIKHRFDILELKIYDLQNQISNIDKSLENNKYQIYKQITEIRNAMQELYKEMNENEKYYHDQIIKLSEKLNETAIEMAKKTGEEKHINISNFSSSSENPEQLKLSKIRSFFGKIENIVILIIGFIMFIGLIASLYQQIFTFFQWTLNIIGA